MRAIRRGTWSFHCFKSARRTNHDFSGCQKNTFGTLLDGCKWWLTAEWHGNRMELETLVNPGPVPTANTLNHLMLSCHALRDLWHSGCGLMADKALSFISCSPTQLHPSCHKSHKALCTNIKVIPRSCAVSHVSRPNPLLTFKIFSWSQMIPSCSRTLYTSSTLYFF